MGKIDRFGAENQPSGVASSREQNLPSELGYPPSDHRDRFARQQRNYKAICVLKSALRLGEHVNGTGMPKLRIARKLGVTVPLDLIDRARLGD